MLVFLQKVQDGRVQKQKETGHLGEGGSWGGAEQKRNESLGKLITTLGNPHLLRHLLPSSVGQGSPEESLSHKHQESSCLQLTGCFFFFFPSTLEQSCPFLPPASQVTITQIMQMLSKNPLKSAHLAEVCHICPLLPHVHLGAV